MIIKNISSYNFGNYNRLSLEDINRLPKHTSSTSSQSQNNISKSKQQTAIKIITVAASALLGLYIAHRNNLFNPVMKETKKILKNPDTFEKINKYVSDNFNFETCSKFTKKFLTKLANDSAQTEAFSKQANAISNNKNEFDKLAKKVFEKLNDDRNIDRFKRGISVDIMDLYLPKIVQKLQKIKDNNQPYKNLQQDIVSDLFKKGQDGTALIEDLFYSAINSRVSKMIIDSIENLKALSEIAN